MTLMLQWLIIIAVEESGDEVTSMEEDMWHTGNGMFFLFIDYNINCCACYTVALK